MEGKTYEASGVSLALADSIVERLRAAVESTGTSGFGAFAGLYPLDEQRFLAASMDSAGTKLVLARKAGRLRSIGADLTAHCVNDVITTGAEPLFFLDYVVGHKVGLEQVAELVEGAAETCRAAGCALLGGETAEMPGVYREEELDFAGTCVGIVERDRVIDGSRVEAGDAVLGLPSLGLHTNGFSLVRALLGDGDFDADLLLAPHKLYVDEVRELRAACRRQGARTRDRRRHSRQPHARPAGGPERRARLGCLGAAASLRLVDRAGSGRRGAAARLQRRDRDVRSRACGRHRRGPGDRADHVIGVLVSGEGTNLQALIDEGLPIAAVASNKSGARALERAEAAGIPTQVFELEDYGSREERDGAMADWLAGHGVQLVVCAGYMHLLRPDLSRALPRPDRQHPSGAAARLSRARIRSRTCWPRARRRPRRPCTTSTKASTPGQ